ncbi:MAG TPA: GIY-YIG nuclease family protein [Allosphingosinicella sp.]
MDVHFYVYMLRCRDGSYYTGHTDDLDARLWQHQNGIGCEWTKRRRPVELVWCEVMPTRDESFAAERRIKNWSRAKKEGLIAGDWQKVSHYARPPRERALSSTGAPARPERNRGAPAPARHERPSTSLGMSDEGGVWRDEGRKV